MWKRGKLSLTLILLEIAFIVLFGVFVRYELIAVPGAEETGVSHGNSTSGGHHGDHTTIPAGGGAEGHGAALSAEERAAEVKNHIPDFYAMFQDIHVMMFIGFGFLMTFLKRYGFGSVGFNFLVAAFILQWATLTHGFIREITPEDRTIRVNVVTLINADFAAATVLISFGAVLGKVSILQLIIMALFEVVFFQVNEFIVFDLLHVTDVGDSLVVHMFGAYFGLMVSRILYSEDVESNEEKEGSVYHSDIFAMIGTIFLWLFWPSFNAGTALEEGRIRAVINTYFSLTASTIVTYAISSLVHKDKFSMIHVQNSTLAGGVAIGTVADMIIQPWGAVLTGAVAGAVSVLGYRYLTPLMYRKLKIHDTCGVHNLHGMPGVIGGIGGIIAARVATIDLYGERGLHNIFWAGRTPPEQAAYQAAGLGVSLGMALVCGAITGVILKLPIWDQPKGTQVFDDEDYWIIEAGIPAASESEEFDKKYDEENNNKHPSPIAITHFNSKEIE